MKKKDNIIALIGAVSILGTNGVTTLKTIDDLQKENITETKINQFYSINAKTSNASMQTTANLNIRSGAGTKYKVLGTLKKGQKITVTSTSNGWAKFTYNGKTAYASAKYLKTVTTSNGNQSNDNQVNAQTGSKSMQTTANLNIRSGAGTKYKVIGTLKKGQKITVTSTSNGWAKFKQNGKNAYVSAKYLKTVTVSNDNQSNNNQSSNTETNTQSKSMQTTAGLNVRSGAGTKHSKIGLLKKGEKVTVISTSNGWAKIKYGNDYGYVSMSYLKDTAIENNTNTDTNTNTNTDTNSDLVGYKYVYEELGNRGWLLELSYMRSEYELVTVHQYKEKLYCIGLIEVADSDPIINKELIQIRDQRLLEALNLVFGSQSQNVMNDVLNNKNDFIKTYNNITISVTHQSNHTSILFQ